MTRRDLLWAVTAGAGASCLPMRAQQPIGYREYAKCLPDAIRMLAAEAYERRKAEIRKLTTTAAIHARQK
jgi:hypothetical protein